MRFVVALLVTLTALPLWANQLKGVRVWPSPDSTRVVLDLASKPRYSSESVTTPDRLIVELEDTTNATNLNKVSTAKSQLVKKVRQSTSKDKDDLTLVFDLHSPVKPIIFPLAPTGPYGHRLVIDFPYEEEPESKAEAIVRSGTAKSSGAADVVIAIDPGHGGEDPGAVGKGGNYEKRVTLAVSQRLAALINREPGMRAVLTRKGDYFVNLNHRSDIARKAKSDLLISIHADSVASSTPRGASVWVLSTKRANREMGRWLEQHEKQSELLGGVGDVMVDADNNYLARTFLDLSMDKSRAEGYNASRYILRQMGTVAKLHKREPQHASLAVLKSPDIPSVLLETGFISNREEERLLTNAAYQQKLATSIYQGLMKYYNQHPTKGPLLAARRSGKKPAAAPQVAATTLLAKNEPEIELEIEPTKVATVKNTTKTKPNSTPAKNSSSKTENITPPKPQLKTAASSGSVSKSAAAIGAGVIKPFSATDITAAPPKTSTKKSGVKHVVKKGETLSRLAERYGVSMARIESYNQLSSRIIQTDQVLYIPKG